MGICHTKKSIEQIIHSKYKLAKDSTKKLNTHQYRHVYIWKYFADDLAQKQVRFYDTQNVDQITTRKDNEKVIKNSGKESIQNCLQGQKQKIKLQQQYLQGQPLQWPLKANADQGYIILTITNKSDHLQSLTRLFPNTLQPTKPQTQLQPLPLPTPTPTHNHLRLLNLPLQLIQLLYMIKLDSFRQYYYTKIQKQQSYQCEYQAQVQIIVGDLVERMECLKLVAIAYQLQKYIKRGGQNVMKMFYNQYERIAYCCVQSLVTQHNGQYNNNFVVNKTSLITTDRQRQFIVQSQIPFQRIFASEIARIMVSQYYQTQEESQKEIDRLFCQFGQVVKRFNVFKDVVFGNERNDGMLFRQVVPKSKQNNVLMKKYNKKYSKTHINKQLSTKIIQQLKQSSLLQQKVTNSQNQQINVFITTKLKNINTLAQSKIIKNNPNEIDQFANLSNQDNDDNNMQQLQNDISIIQKPTNNKKKNKKSGEFDKQIQRKEARNFNINKNNTSNNKLDMSSPFICEITQIDGMGNFDDNQDINEDDGNDQVMQRGNNNNNLNAMRQQKNKSIKKTLVLQQQGNVGDQSMFLPKELQQLQINKNIYELNVGGLVNQQRQQQHLITPLLLTTYAGSSQFHEIQRRNVSLIINLSPWECYNYFINDVEYDWYWMERLEQQKELLLTQKGLQQIDDINNRWRYNIECLITTVVYRIQVHLQIMAKQQLQQQQNNLSLKKQQNLHANVLVFCSHKNMIYSGLVAVGYLMLSNSYRLTLNDAIQVVKKSTNGKFQMPKMYEQQLRNLQARVNQLSSTVNLNTLNTKTSSSYRAYEVDLYTEKDRSLIVGRYIGELSTSNQLQTLPNNQLKSYFLIPNNLTSIIMKSINILREDASLMNSNNFNEKISTISKLIKNMGLTLRVFYGKQLMTEHKTAYLEFVRQQLLVQLVRYEYINFSRKIFNVQKYKAKIDLIIQALKQLITSQYIEKSFRKPQAFDQDPLTLVNDMNLLTSTPMIQKSHRQQPFNSKQTLTFKYPILRPIFESKKKDSYYFMIKKFIDQNKKDKQMGCNVTFYKGDGWIGLEEDKQRYFERIVHEYLRDVHQQRIWIEDEQSNADQSLFDRESILF